MDKESEKVTIRLPKRYLRAIDFLVTLDDFSSRSEAIREAIREMVYDRIDLVMDKVKKLERAEETLAGIESFQEQYIKR